VVVPKAGNVSLAVFVVLATAGVLTAEELAGAVRYAKDRLTVHAQGVPLRDILGEIARQSGADVRGAVRKPRGVSEDFEDVPLAKGLERLLGEQSFALRYGREGELRTIKLLGEAVAAATPSIATESSGEPQPGSSAGPRGGGGGVGGGASAHPPVSARGATAKVRSAASSEGKTGRKRKRRQEDTDHTPEVPAMFGAAAQQNPAASQDQASTNDQPLTGDELERKLRRNVLNTLNQMDDATLTAYLATPEGKRVAALLQYYAGHHPSSSANGKANGILDRVTGQPSPPPPVRR
jgi:hypothetical protein